MESRDGAAPDAGFTLIEAIVSFIILAMVLGSVTLSLSYSARLQRKADAKLTALVCAQTVLAEKFDKRKDQPASESGIRDETCRWQIERKIAQSSYTESGRNLMRFRIKILNAQGRVAEMLETYYLEDLK